MSYNSHSNINRERIKSRQLRMLHMKYKAGAISKREYLAEIEAIEDDDRAFVTIQWILAIVGIIAMGVFLCYYVGIDNVVSTVSDVFNSITN